MPLPSEAKLRLVNIQQTAARAEQELLDLRDLMKLEGEQIADLKHQQSAFTKSDKRHQALATKIGNAEKSLSTLELRLTYKEQFIRHQKDMLQRCQHSLSALNTSDRYVMAAVRPEAITKDSLHGAIMARREELAMIRKRTKALLIAQPALADAHKLIRDYVAQLAAKARPELKLQPVKLEFALRWTNPTEYLLPLLAWFDPDRLINHLEAMALDRCEEDALTADEKRDQIAQLDELAHKIEVAEEALVVRAHEAGIDVHRRADVDPRVVLGLEPATVTAARAAA